MSTELSNGVIIPEEYSDDWYDEMSINLRKLNDVITAASDNATDIQRLDTDKANQSDLTALTSRVSQNETDITALQTAVSGALKREIVQTLPTEDISTTTIYMIRNSQSSGTNIYDEYMYINSQWELIGTSATDFSNYYTKNETDNLLSGKVDNSTLGSYYTKTESDTLLSAKANQTDLTSLSGRVTQTETDITALQTAVSGALKREIVQTLPTQDISTTTIYMIRNTTTSGDNIYDEYMYINNLWELIGTSATDFSNYYTKTEIDTLLSYKASDSDVVHKSGNETVGGEKTFTSSIKGYNSDSTQNTVSIGLRTSKVSRGSTSDGVDTFGFDFRDKNNSALASISCVKRSTGGISEYHTVTTTDSSNNVLSESYSFNLGKDGNSTFRPETNNKTLLGTSTNNWKGVYATNYYYGSNNVEFSTKFVTTDTNQSVSGQKVFTDINAISSSAEIGVSAGNNSFKVLDKNKKILSRLEGGTFSGGSAYSYWLVNNGSDVFNGVSLFQASSNLAQLRPYSSTLSMQLGASFRSFSDCYTSKINSLTPSSLSLPDIANKIDISSYITDLTGVSNEYTPSVNGWICVRSANANKISILDRATSIGTTSVSPMATYLGVLVPCIANRKVNINIICTSLEFAYFIPCLGNI